MKVLNNLINLIYPPKCVFCRQLMKPGSSCCICENCYKQLPFAGNLPLTPTQKGEESSCDNVICLFRYREIVKESLIRFKFFNKPGYYRAYAELLANQIAGTTGTGKFDGVLSVPLHRDREISRGYNQAALISRELGRRLKLPEYSGTLKRTRKTGVQSLLDKQERYDNIKGAFMVTVPCRIKAKNLLLIDDIMTTGATLEECCRVLKEAGADGITAAVVAAGRK